MELEPDTVLDFQGPFTRGLSKAILVIRNAEESALVFKVKTTTPKHYCVRPNAGLILPGESLQVLVLLQPLREEPAPDFKCKDKFLVQGIQVTSDGATVLGDTGPDADLWTQAQEFKVNERVLEKRLRVNYIIVSGAEGTPAGVDASQSDSQPRSSDPAVFSAASTPSSALSVQSKPVSIPTPVSLAASTLEKGQSLKPTALKMVTASSQSPAEVKDMDITPKPHKVLFQPPPVQDQDTARSLQEVKEENKRLQSLVEKYQRELMMTRAELRQRHTGPGSQSAGSQGAGQSAQPALHQALRSPHQAAYSLTVVLMAAFLSFLIGYLFF